MTFIPEWVLFENEACSAFKNLLMFKALFWYLPLYQIILKTIRMPHSPRTTRFLGSQFSTRKKVHFQFTLKWNFNIRIRVSFQNENHNEGILECSLPAEASFPSYSSPGGRGMEVLKDVLYGETSPQGPTSYPFIQLFWERLTEKMCMRQSRKVIWDMINNLFLTL